MHKYKTHVAYKGDVAGRCRAEEVLGKLILERFSGDGGCVVIAVGGPGGSGKSTFAGKLAAELGDASILRLDDYKTPREERSNRNIFGAHPDANMMELAAEHISLVRENKTFEKPVYDNVTGEANGRETYRPRRFNILDGEISTYKKFRHDVDLSVFIDSDYKTQLATRTSRDIVVRGYTWEKAIATFLQSNLREFTKYGAESKKWADVHLYCREDYSVVVESVASELYEHFESLLAEYLTEVDFSGLVVPVTTPFSKSNEIDKRMFIEHLELLAKQGVKRILVNGTTGEFFSLGPEERKMILKLAREYFPGVIMFHAGYASLAETETEARWGQEYGADAVVAITPYYLADLPAGGLVDYFNHIASQIDVPFILYNFPKHTQNSLTAELLGRIKHFGMKDSSGDLSLVDAAEHYYIGGDGKILAAYEKGAYGFVSARGNAFGPMYVEIEKAVVGADCNKAKEMQTEISQLKSMMTSVNEIAKIKYAVSKQLDGYPVGVRLPLVGLSKGEMKAMDAVVSRFAVKE